MKKTALAVGLAFVLCVPVGYADEAPQPKIHTDGGSTYASGGVGAAQRKAMFRIANRFPIQLIFEVEGQKGDISGVKVTLIDQVGNKLIEAVSEGPYFYMNPPAGGRFTIEAEYKGEKQSMTKDLVGRRYMVLEYKFHAK
jgi:hypothetical protein